MKPENWLVLLLALALSGCGSLLPKGSSDTPSAFADFAEASAAAQRIQPFRTKVVELKALGFDPDSGNNVTLIPYPDIVARLAPHPGVPMAQLDPGVRTCIEAQARCHAYVFHFERQDRRRAGGFWLDFFNLRRITAVTGWWFDALVVVNADTVLFTNFAGQAHTERVEKQTNPLGPLQSAGERLSR